MVQAALGEIGAFALPLKLFELCANELFASLFQKVLIREREAERRREEDTY